MKWIDDDLLLEGERVLLKPLQADEIDELIKVGNDPRIWQFLAIKFEEQYIRKYFFEDGLLNREKGTHFPFTVFDKAGSIIGTTRFTEIEPDHKKLEIGWTWYKRDVWGTGINEECKYLMMSYAFEKLGAIRVQLKTNDKNYRSQQAILRVGCKFEGILRNHIIREGFIRKAAIFSLVKEEWPRVKENLRAIIAAKYSGTYQPELDSTNLTFGD